jgi:hypothetical protein
VCKSQACCKEDTDEYPTDFGIRIFLPPALILGLAMESAQGVDDRNAREKLRVVKKPPQR